MQRVAGQVERSQTRAVLRLRKLKPGREERDLLYLRFALVTIGPGDHIFPAFVLDDWGREIASLGLYAWIREHGERFPRGEVFGFERDGRETQCFLRELELYARLPCYVYPSSENGVETGIPLDALAIEDDNCLQAKRIKRPPNVSGPLRAARLSWWRVPHAESSFDFAQLTDADPGY